jgi:hypothetical protein
VAYWLCRGEVISAKYRVIKEAGWNTPGWTSLDAIN